MSCRAAENLSAESAWKSANSPAQPTGALTVSLKSASSIVLIKSFSRSQNCAQTRCDPSVTLTHSVDEVCISFLAETRGFSTVMSKNPSCARVQTVSNPQQQRTRTRDLICAKNLIKGADEHRAGWGARKSDGGHAYTATTFSNMCFILVYSKYLHVSYKHTLEVSYRLRPE